MANPSLKNGYLSIATELVEQLANKNIPGTEMRLIWTVWRKTWGWMDGKRKKDWDWISYSQFETLTGLGHRSVGKCLKSLVAKRLLLKSEKGYKFNQNYDDWVVVKRLLVAKRVIESSQKATKTSSQKATHKRNIKETLTKDISEPSSEVFDLKKEIQRLEDNPQRALQVLGLYLKEKVPDIRTKAQLSQAIKRHIRAATGMAVFDDDQIIKSFRRARDQTAGWTIETSLKMATK